MFFFEFKRLSSEVKMYKDLVSKDFQRGFYFYQFYSVFNKFTYSNNFLAGTY